MKGLVNEFTFRFDLFEVYKGKFLYIESFHCDVIYEEFKTISECLCEAVRKKLFDASTSSKLKQVKYYYENCSVSIPEYPMQSGYINRSNPLIISNWTKHGIDNETNKSKNVKQQRSK